MPDYERAEVSVTPGCIKIRDDADICHQALPVMRTGQHLLFPADHLHAGMMLLDDLAMIGLSLAKGSGGLQILLTPEGADQLILGLQRAAAKAEAHNHAQAARQVQATLAKGKSGGI